MQTITNPIEPNKNAAEHLDRLHEIAQRKAQDSYNCLAEAFVYARRIGQDLLWAKQSMSSEDYAKFYGSTSEGLRRSSGGYCKCAMIQAEFDFDQLSCADQRNVATMLGVLPQMVREAGDQDESERTEVRRILTGINRFMKLTANADKVFLRAQTKQLYEFLKKEVFCE